MTTHHHLGIVTRFGVQVPNLIVIMWALIVWCFLLAAGATPTKGEPWTEKRPSHAPVGSTVLEDRYRFWASPVASENLVCSLSQLRSTGHGLSELGPGGNLEGPFSARDMAMGQKPNRTPSEHPIPTKMGSKMGGAPNYPKMVPLVLTHSHMHVLFGN